MSIKKQKTGGNRRASNKKFVGLWIEDSVYAVLNRRADKDEHGNKSDVILRALEKYLEDDLKKNNTP